MTNEHQNTYNHTHTHKHLNHYHIRIRYFIIQLFFISQIANFSIRGQDLASKTSQIISFQRSRQALFTLIAKNSLLCSEYQGLEEQKQAWLCGRKRWCMLSVFLVSERKEVFLFPSCRRRPFLTTRSEAEGRGESSYLPPAHTEPWWLSHIWLHHHGSEKSVSIPSQSWTLDPDPSFWSTQELRRLCYWSAGFTAQCKKLEREWRASESLLTSEASDPHLPWGPARTNSSSTLFMSPAPNYSSTQEFLPWFVNNRPWVPFRINVYVTESPYSVHRVLALSGVWSSIWLWVPAYSSLPCLLLHLHLTQTTSQQIFPGIAEVTEILQ